MNGVHRTCAETAAFHMEQAMQQPQSATSTPLPWILIIRAIKRYSHSFRITCDMCALSLPESREQRYINAMNNNNNNNNNNIVVLEVEDDLFGLCGSESTDELFMSFPLSLLSPSLISLMVSVAFLHVTQTVALLHVTQTVTLLHVTQTVTLLHVTQTVALLHVTQTVALLHVTQTVALLHVTQTVALLHVTQTVALLHVTQTVAL